jgi:2,3-dihydroxyphenylpropionate 1,2-dioxygenase
MGEVVLGISMSHAPGILGWPEAPAADKRERMQEALETLSQQLDATHPDVLIAFLDDHFDNHFRNLMPTFAVGIAASHAGPSEHYFEMLRIDRKREVPSNEEMSEALLTHLVHNGFDAARMGHIEYGNNLMVALALIRDQLDIPVVPVFINVFSPPITPPARAYQLGELVRSFVDGRPERVGFLATGGLSHWPPFWTETSPACDPLLARMKRFQTEGRPYLKEDPGLMTDVGKWEQATAAQSDEPLVNEAWDREFLDALGRGDSAFMKNLTFTGVEQDAGNGGHEVLNWIALMGAMRGEPAEILAYEPVKEWICGMGFALYRG